MQALHKQGSPKGTRHSQMETGQRLFVHEMLVGDLLCVEHGHEPWESSYRQSK